MSALYFIIAAVTEIAGCFAFWAWLRMSGPWWWVLPGLVSLAVFALALTRVDSAFAGRAYAAYGGVYITAAIVWLWLIEGQRPDMWDALGGAICLGGTAVILFGPRP